MDGFRLRFVPLGGVVGVTKNMYLYELYQGQELKDILIVDCGIGFPQDKTLGVDFVIPDITYLTDKVDKIRAVILSHGHEDHTAALPFYYQELGQPNVYTGNLTSTFVKNKFKEFGTQVKLNNVDLKKEYQFGDFKVEFINITHSIPDTLHMVIKTPIGNLYHGTDFKLDLTPPYGRWPDFYKILKLSHENGILCLLSDCLGVETAGLTLSESAVWDSFDEEMRKTKGKFLMTTFSSNISRIRQCLEVAAKYNRKVTFLGRSMKENTNLAKEIGYLPASREAFIDEKKVMQLSPNKVCIIAAGSQGQYDSALAKLAGNQNPNIKIKSGDKVVFSSDPVPGNEAEVYALIEELSLRGAEIVYPDIREQLHASGHGNQEDLKFLIRFTNPKYFIPIGGTIRHQHQYQKLVTELGYRKESVFLLAEGETVWFEKGGAKLGEQIETKNVYVDAYGVGDIGHIVLRDRKTLSAEGMVVVVLLLDNNGQMTSPARIISRGFVFEKVERELFDKAQQTIGRVLKPRPGKVLNLGNLKQQVAEALEEFFFKEKGRRPLIIIDIIQI